MYYFSTILQYVLFVMNTRLISHFVPSMAIVNVQLTESHGKLFIYSKHVKLYSFKSEYTLLMYRQVEVKNK